MRKYRSRSEWIELRGLVAVQSKAIGMRVCESARDVALWLWLGGLENELGLVPLPRERKTIAVRVHPC